MLDRGRVFYFADAENYRENLTMRFISTGAPVMSSTNPNDTNHNGQGGMVSYSDRSLWSSSFEDDNEVQQMLHNR